MDGAASPSAAVNSVLQGIITSTGITSFGTCQQRSAARHFRPQRVALLFDVFIGQCSLKLYVFENAPQFTTSRRRFLGGVSLLALSAALPSPSLARFRGITVSSTTSPTTKTNLDPGLGILLNIFQTASNWKYPTAPTTPNVPTIPLAELDSNGYPTAIVAGTRGAQASFALYPVEIYSGIYALDWSGNGTIVVPGNGSTTGFIPNTGYSFANQLRHRRRGRFEFSLKTTRRR